MFLNMRKSITLLLLLLGFGMGAVDGQVIFTEINYQSPIGGGTDSLEYIEMYNPTATPVDMTGWTMVGVGYTFPAFTLDPGRFVLICRNSPKIINTFGYVCQIFNWTSGFLANSAGEALVLKNSTGSVIDSLFYTPGLNNWPTANGDGRSISYCNQTIDNINGSAWIATTTNSGFSSNGLPLFLSPGACCDQSDNVPPTIVGTKFSNYNRVAIRFSEPVSLPTTWAGNFSANNSNIASASYGMTNDSVILMLQTPLSDGVSDRIVVNWAQDTACNSLVADSFIVLNNYVTDWLNITEILYDDAMPFNDLEFIEVKNVWPNPIPLAGFRFEGDLIGYLPDYVLQPDERIVFARNPALVSSTFSISNVYSWGTGTLPDAGARIELWNDAGMNDSMTYNGPGQWPTGISGSGHSILMCQESNDDVDFGSWTKSYSGDFTVVYLGDSVFATPLGNNCRPTGVDPTFEADIQIYPNPFHGVFEVKSKLSFAKTAHVRDELGRLVSSQSFEDGYALIDLSARPKGLYFLTIFSDEGVSLLSRKVVNN